DVKGVSKAPADVLQFKPRVLALDDQALKDRDDSTIATMEEEYSNVIEPKLIQEVIDVMSAGGYPSSEVRMSYS
ncbi:hypothetical protein Tco_0560109, partial [Tanacetum coccineum]